ncbi:MAG TPA: hypothetical protein VIT92_15080 [Burkholderiaceae bacterium]
MSDLIRTLYQKIYPDIRRKDAGYLATVLSDYAAFDLAYRKSTLSSFDEVEACYWSLRRNRVVHAFEGRTPGPGIAPEERRYPQSTGSYLRELFQVEKAVLELQSLPTILARTPLLVERFRILASDKADALKRRYDQELSTEKLEKIWFEWSKLQPWYSGEEPPGIALTGTAATLPTVPGNDGGEVWLRAKLAILLGDIQWWSAQNQVREELFLGQQMQLIIWFVIFALAGAAVYAGTEGCANVDIVLAVAFFGLLGAFTSIMRRMHNDTDLQQGRVASYRELTALAYGKIGIVFGLLFGATFALVLMLVFFGGIIDNVFSEDVARVSDNFFPLFAQDPGDMLTCSSMQPASGGDLGKLLFWSFIAGFAEKIVPDALDRLTRAASPVKK